jgi:hypothetical protein
MEFLHSLFRRPKRKYAEFSLGEEEIGREMSPDTTVGQEILVIPDDDDDPPETKGEGSKDDPIQFFDWTTGNVISATDNGAFIDLASDDEDHGDKESTPCRSPEAQVRTQGPRKTPRLTKNGVDKSSPSIETAIGLQNGIPGTNARVPGSSTLEFEEDGDGFDCEVIIIPDNDEREYKYTQDWSFIKEEPEESVPELTSSQASEATTAQDGCGQEPHAYTASNILGLEEQVALHGRLAANSVEPVHVMPKVGKDRHVEVTRIPMVWEIDLALDQAEKTKLKKKLFFYTYGPRLLPRLEKVVQRYRSFASGGGSRQDCWLSTDPRLFTGTSQRRNISTKVSFRHEHESYDLQVNFGFIHMMVEGLLTLEHKKGIVEHRWHASHLCGNWTCMNPRHINPEEGSINLNRNTCFAQPEGPCSHYPKCLKHLKIVGSLDPVDRRLLETHNVVFT